MLPALRSDLFQGLRAPARGLLLYGPPGNGKTLLAKALAHEARATFFNISAASLTSKWHGEAEKLVRALFRVAGAAAPSVIFIDEMDSLLSARGEGEHDAARRLKTEFLSAFDGVAAAPDHVVVLGATNRPWELDDAVLRRLPKRILVPLPGRAGRSALLERMLTGQKCEPGVAAAVAAVTSGCARPSGPGDFCCCRLLFHPRLRMRGGDGGFPPLPSPSLPPSPPPHANPKHTRHGARRYSGSDLAAVCKEAAMAPLRELGPRLATVPADRIRGLTRADFAAALKTIRPSLTPEAQARFDAWTEQHGTTA